MRSILSSLGRGTSLLLPLLLATGGQGQEVKPAVPAAPPGVHRMVIYNGSSRTVRYFSDNLSPGENEVVKELEHAENEATYVDNLQTLKQQYVKSELMLEPYRRWVQKALYGVNINNSVASGVGSNGFYGPGRFGSGYAYPSGYVYPYNLGGYGYGYGGGGYSGYAGTSSNDAHSLANGMGYEGVMKTSIAQAVAQQTSPQYATAAYGNYNRALAAASDSPRVRVALGLPREGAVRAAAYGATTRRPVTLTLKNGEKIRGNLVREDDDWIEVSTGTEDITVRKNEVTRMSSTTETTPPKK